MAVYEFRGDAPAIAQVDTIEVTDSWATSDTLTVTINGKALVLTVGSTSTTTQIASDLADMINGAAANGDESRSALGTSFGEWREVTATVNSSTVTVTADTAGKPFTLTGSVSTAGDGDITVTNEVTANSGPNAVVAANFRDVSSGANGTPGNGDSIHFRDSDVDLLYGLDALSNTLTAVYCWGSYTGKIGLPNKNTDNAGYPYDEYRPRRLTVAITTLEIGMGPGSQSQRLWFDFENVQNTTIVYQTGNAETAGTDAVQLHGTHASNAYTVKSGSVGLAAFSGDATTIAALTVEGGQVRAYEGAAAATTIRVDGGTLSIKSNITTLYLTKGTVNTAGSNTIGTAHQTGGKLTHNSTGTITTLNQDGGTSITYGTLTTVNLDSGTCTTKGAGTIGTGNVTGGQLIHQSSGAVTTLNVGGGSRSAVFDSTGAPADLAVGTPTLSESGELRRAKGQTYTNDVAMAGTVRSVRAA